MLRIVHPLQVVVARQIALRVLRNGRAESRQELVRRVAGHVLLALLVPLHRRHRHLGRLRAIEIAHVHSLRDAASVLPRGSFGAHERNEVARLRDLGLRRRPRLRARSRVEGERKEIARIDADVLRVAAVGGVAAAEGDRDRVAAKAGVDERRRGDRARRRLHAKHVAGIDAESRGGRCSDLDHRLPAHLGDWIRNLLEPRLVRAAAIFEQR